MPAPTASSHLERIRRVSAYPGLRLAVDVMVALGNVALVIAAVAALKYQGWISGMLLLYALPIYVGRGLALALLDIADVQLRQSVLAETQRPEA